MRLEDIAERPRALALGAVLVAAGVGSGLLVYRLTEPVSSPEETPNSEVGPAGARGVARAFSAADVGGEAPAPSTGAAPGSDPGTPPRPRESRAAGPEELPGASLASADPPLEPDSLPALSFAEIWAYLYRGEEEHWDESLPVTDLCLFNFRVDDTGRVEGDLDPEFAGRVRSRGVRTHLVVAASGKRSLFHFLLDPRHPARDRLLAELAELPRRYPVDGLQLDFEGLRPEERESLVAFLEIMARRLPERCIFSLAVPAKISSSSSAYHYRDLRSIADRFFIMAYDFHWQGGPPGPVTPKDWLGRVVTHALRELPREAVVIGLPFYGRIWQKTRVARAIRHEDLAGHLERPGVALEYDPERSHRFTYTRAVEVEGWFDDARSLHAKLRAARNAGARAVGFWRLGQEDPRIWSFLRRE